MSKPIHVDAIQSYPGSGYPHPYDRECLDREKQLLGEEFGLTAFGVNIVRMPPASWSSQRHFHSREDELIYVLAGKPTLVTDEGETTLEPGSVAGFKGGDRDGHHLVNKTDADVVYLEVGNRAAGDEVEFPDIDLKFGETERGWAFTHKDGSHFD